MRVRLSGFIFLLCFISWVGNVGLAQSFASKDRYLVDSLDLDKIGENDRILIDSVLNLYHKAPNDTTKLQLIDAIVENMIGEEWFLYNQLLESKIEAHFNNHPNSPDSLFYLRMYGECMNNVGYQHMMHGRLPYALDAFEKSLSVAEKTENKSLEGSLLINFGYIHNMEGERDTAMVFLRRAIDLFRELKDTSSLSIAINNLAAMHERNRQFDKALILYRESLKLEKIVNASPNIALTMNNIGYCYTSTGELEKAYHYSLQSLDLSEKLNDKRNIAYCYMNLGQVNVKKSQYDSAEYYLQGALDISTELESPEMIEMASGYLYDLYKKTKNHEKALAMFEKNRAMKDSLENIENSKELYKMELRHQFQKQKEIDERELQHQAELDDKVKHQQQLVIYFVLASLLAVSIFLIILSRKLKLTREQRNIIEEQKQHVDEAYEELNQTNEEILAQRDQIETQKQTLEEHNSLLNHQNSLILDSIYYARNLQETILTTKEDVAQHFSEFFVFYRPKDIVSGDFYWMRERNGVLYVAVADCTGHGVSGALLTIFCHRILEKAADKYKFSDAAEMLNYAHTEIIKLLKRQSQSTVDGMDIALCIFDKKSNPNSFNYAGAHQPALIVRNGEKIILKANNRPIGFSYKHREFPPFTSQQFECEEGDMLYLFSDGFSDQFGGKDGTKFFASNLHELLTSHAELHCKNQEEKLHEVFEQWKGEREQIDDICVFGLRF